MRFLLEPGDAVAVRPCGPDGLRAGDLALLVKWTVGLPSGYVIHRVLLNLSLPGKKLLLTKGDANFLPDWPPSAFQAAGKADFFERGGLRFELPRGLFKAFLLSAYSLAVNKALYLAAYLAAALFSLACRLLPPPLTEPLGLLYLAWESRAYPALLKLSSAPALPRGGRSGEGFAGVKCGRIRSDETWSGLVTVADYLIIERGARITVLPGTEINFTRREPWFFPVMRAGEDGSLRELDSGLAKALVYGEFTAQGTKDAPVRFGGDSFGGVHALGTGKITLRHCSAVKAGSWAFSARDGGFLDAESAAFTGCRRGVEVAGQGAAFLRNCAFSGMGGPAARALDGASLVLSGGSVSGAEGPAFEVSDGASAAFHSVAVRDAACAVGLEGASSLTARGCSFEGNGAGLSAGDGSDLSLADCSFSGNRGPALEISGHASVSAEKCLFEKNGGPAAEVSGRAKLRLADCRSSGENPSLLLRGDSSGSFSGVSARSGSFPALSAAGRAGFSAADCSFTSGADAVYFRSSGRAGFRGCSLDSAAGAALNLRSGEAGLRDCSLKGRGGLLAAYPSEVKLRDVRISAGAYGIDSSAASFFAAGLTLTGGELGGILLSAGVNRLVDSRVEEAPYPGIALAGGAKLSSERVTFSGRPWLYARPRAARPSLKKLLFRIAAATASRPLFSSIYRRIYLFALPAARLLLRGPGLRSLYLYRGMADKGWVPGLSDMDLACVLEASSPEKDFSFYSGLRRRLRLLKSLFPFTGELMLSTEADFVGFLNCWGVKGAEFPGASRLLSGRPVELSPRPRDASLADTTEAFYAYTLLMRHFFSEGLPETFLRRNCLKNLVDIRRYLDPASPERYSRASYAAGLGLPLEKFMSLEKTEAAYQAFRALHAASPRAAGGPGPGPSAPAARLPGWFNQGAFDAACRNMAESAGVGLGAALDSLYRTYVVLPDGAADDKAAYLRACAALRKARAASPMLSASPLVLTWSSFARLCRLPYLNNPMFWADLAVTPAGGRGPDDGGVYCYNLAPDPVPQPAGAARAAALLAARHFCASWRSLWDEMPPHYFYTRSAGLRLLLETGGSPEFAARGRLGETLRERTGAALPAWDAYLAGGAGRINYEYISSQAAVLGRLADAG